VTRTRALAACLVAAVAATALGATAIAVRAVRAELRTFEPTHYEVPRPAEEWLARAVDVHLATTKGVAMSGWRLPSKNGAAVVLVHGSFADRRQLLPEAQILAGAGYGVILFDLPGNGESGGERRHGAEQDFIRLALDATSAAPDVRPDRIGAYGFSGGAAVLAEVAAEDRRVRAVVLAGCYEGTDQHVRHDFRQWGALSGTPALWAARWAGMVPLYPIRAVRAIAPRPIFFLSGNRDDVVPPESVEALYGVASEPKELWVVDGATHGHYADAAGDEYARRLVAFFDRTLTR
jgi:pimeloyl-ACP methyl ester carboxylesterase